MSSLLTPPGVWGGRLLPRGVGRASERFKVNGLGPGTIMALLNTIECFNCE